MTTPRILIADDEQPARFGMVRALAREGWEILEAADGRAALELIRTALPDLVFLDLAMPALDGRSVLRELGPAARTCEIVVVTATDRIATAVDCMQLGAADYITKPFEVEQLRAIARRVARRLELERQVDQMQTQLDGKQACGALVGISRPMRQLYHQMGKAAAAPVDILIRGETGTGKELIAREMHRLSSRAQGPFVAVNTAAIADSLAESELFGHVRGAFTGAAADRKGVFEQADGGSLFLDEIGDMPLPAQTRILRAIQERVVQPVGAAHVTKIDVRIISATHQDLEAAIIAGRFRQDLYYRVRGVELRVPPLRARREDILVLSSYFLDRLTAQTRTPSRPLSAGAVQALLAHSWPGNVRELEQTIAAAHTLAEGVEIRAADLGLTDTPRSGLQTCLADFADLPLTEGKATLVEAYERAMIAKALADHASNVSAAARQLGIHRQNLQQKMAQLGLKEH
jgi:DNA-binding NtrC family response regulator